MRFNSKLKNLTKIELLQLLEFIDKALNFSLDEPFSKLTNRLNSIIPHDFFLCGCVEVEKKALRRVKDLVNHSYPKEWMKIYFKNNYQAIDPILITHFSAFKPQRWSETYQKHPDIDSDFLSMSQEFNLIEGLTHGIFEPKDSTGTIFSFAGSSIEPSSQQLICLQIIIPHLHQAFIRFCRKKTISEEIGVQLPLSQREIEALNWIKMGKTNWEISVILKISERTVKFHVSNILRKLNASTRGHAVAKALELEIITL